MQLIMAVRSKTVILNVLRKSILEQQKSLAGPDDPLVDFVFLLKIE